jgi:hypothetical protein
MGYFSIRTDNCYKMPRAGAPNDALSVAGSQAALSDASKKLSKARAFTFLVKLNPEQTEGGVEGIGDWVPDPCPKELENTYSCGSVFRSGDEDSFWFTGYAEFKHQVTHHRVALWLGSLAEVTVVNIKDRESFITKAKNPINKIDGTDLLNRHWEVGSESRLSQQGKRTDVDDIKDILVKYGPIEGRKIVANKFPGYFMRYPNGIEQLADILQPTSNDKSFTPRPWQQALIEILKKPAHNRWIYWILDEKGAAGKSRLTTFLCCEMNAIEVSGRSQDIAYAYQSQPIVVFDIARPTKIEQVNDLFEAAEKLKDGRLFSTKYMSKTKSFKPPHVVFFSNSHPPAGVWSADRLQLIQISSSPEFSATSKPIDVSPDEEIQTGVMMFTETLQQINKKRLDEREAKRLREEEE